MINVDLKNETPTFGNVLLPAVKKVQKSIFDYSEIISVDGNWKIVHREDANTARIEKWSDGKKEFEILLDKKELTELLSLSFNCR
jgi:hypothetical protein